jgi:hypothetical protein
MAYLQTLLFVMFLPTLTVAASRPQASAPAESALLATVTIPIPVIASGVPLPKGTYQVRFAADEQAGGIAAAGAAQRRVEFAVKGSVVARDIAEVIRDDDAPGIGASSQPAAQGVRVDLLKGGEFLRISVKRDGVRYLIHLSVAP